MQFVAVARRGRNHDGVETECAPFWATTLATVGVSQDRGLKIWSFDRWVNHNNIPASFEFAKGWLRHGLREWAVSVERRTPYGGPLFGLIREAEDLRDAGLDGLSPTYSFGSYRENQARFTALVRHEWDVAALMRIMAHEG